MKTFKSDLYPNEKCTNQETSNDSNNSLLNNLKIANYQNII